MHLPYRTDKSDTPMSLVVAEDRTQDPDATLLPHEFRNTILLDVIHDGDWIPEEFMVDESGNAIPEEFYGPVAKVLAAVYRRRRSS